MLPSLIFLKSKGLINDLTVCGTNGNKLKSIKAKFSKWCKEYNFNFEINYAPDDNQIDYKRYIKELDKLKSPSAAIIAVPDHLHMAVMLECTKRNIPFLIVKPAVVKLDELYQIIESKNSNFPTFVDFHKVYDDANLILKNDIDHSTYGQIHHISSLMTQRRDMLDIYTRWININSKLNINHYLGSHYIHLTGFITKATPLCVRATQQFGYAKKLFNKDIADSIQTHITWMSPEEYEFSSYHIAGWNDPSSTESMTYQEIHLLTENGHVFSDQRYRGLRKVIEGQGMTAPNPYFFSPIKNLQNILGVEGNYGFESIKIFLDEVIRYYLGKKNKDMHLPTLEESDKVTAILEAADLSLDYNGKIVQIEKIKGKYQIKID